MAIDRKEDHGPMKLIFNYNNVFYSFFYDDLSGCIHRSREFALNYVYSGEMILDNGAEQIRVRKGECVFIPRDHHITMYKKTYRGERYCGIFLMFTRSFLREMYSKLSINRIRPNTDRLPDGAINAAAADPRIKATLASTMYDMSRVDSNGYFDADDNAEARNALRERLAAQRTEDYINGTPKLGGGVPDVLPDDAPKFLRDYHDYYKTQRGYHPRSLNSNGGRNVTATIPWINFPLMSRADEIENAVMIIHGEKAHSFYFGSDAYRKLTVIPGKENNKLFMVIPGASHTDLYDQKDIIPFASIEKFFSEYLGE